MWHLFSSVFSWRRIICFLRYSRVEKCFSQKLQLWILSALCTLSSCILRWLDPANIKSQYLHLFFKFLIFRCTSFLCLVRSPLRQKHFPQLLHSKISSPPWTFSSCFFKSALSKNAFSHVGHLCLFIFSWILRICSLSWVGKLNTLPHWLHLWARLASCRILTCLPKREKQNI